MPVSHCGSIDRLALRDSLESRRERLTEDRRLRVARIRDQPAEARRTEEPDEDATDLDLTLVEIVTDTLQVIDAAIARLDRGQYGICARCMRAISEARLRALPFAVLCHECQSVREREAALAQSPARRRSWERGDQSAADHDSV